MIKDLQSSRPNGDHATKRRARLAITGLVVLLGFTVVGCADFQTDPYEEVLSTQRGDSTQQDAREREARGGIFGEGGLNLFGGDSKKSNSGDGGGIGVNSFLWRATLDTISFMPMSSADPFGGVIITDWYTPPETSGERFKLNVYILGRALRADGVRVAVFRQILDGAAGWRDAPVTKQTGVSIEDSILMRARQLRGAAVE